MSQENVELVRRMYEHFGSGDAEEMFACFDSEVVVDASRRVDGEVGRGHEALTRIIGQWIAAFERWDEEIEEIRDLGSQVLVCATQRGRGRISGIDIDYRYAVLYAVQDGRITRMTLYPDAAAALEAAGLGE